MVRQRGRGSELLTYHVAIGRARSGSRTKEGEGAKATYGGGWEPREETPTTCQGDATHVGPSCHPRSGVGQRVGNGRPVRASIRSETFDREQSGRMWTHDSDVSPSRATVCQWCRDCPECFSIVSADPMDAVVALQRRVKPCQYDSECGGPLCHRNAQVRWTKLQRCLSVSRVSGTGIVSTNVVVVSITVRSWLR